MTKVILSLVLIVALFKISTYVDIFGSEPNSSEKTDKFEIGQGISVSPDGKSFVFELIKNKDSISIGISSTQGGHGSELIASGKESFVRPQYSKDGRFILFIRFLNHKVAKSKICIYNVSTKELITVPSEENSYITDAIFSSDGKKIFFCMAQVFTHYSPIGTSQPHNIDIYSMNLDGSNVTQLTNFNAYALNSLSNTNSSNNLLFWVQGNNSSISLLSLDTKKSEFYNPINDSIEIHKIFTGPKLSQDNTLIVFNAFYSIYLMPISTRIAEKIYRSEGSLPECLNFYNNDKNLLFTQHIGDDAYEIISLDIKNGRYNTIEIDM